MRHVLCNYFFVIKKKIENGACIGVGVGVCVSLYNIGKKVLKLQFLDNKDIWLIFIYIGKDSLRKNHYKPTQKILKENYDLLRKSTLNGHKEKASSIEV